MKCLMILPIVIFINPFLYGQNCDVCEKLKNNVVQITTLFEDGKEENGFGTVIGERDNKLYIVTAKHVLYNLDGRGFISTDNKTRSVLLKFLTDQGKDYPAVLLRLPNSNLDISLLEVDRPKNYTWEKNFYSATIQKNTRVWFIGRAGKWYIPTGSFVGTVNDFSPNDEVLIDINSIQPGTSGAPLISADGLVGLIFEDAAGGAKAYPVEKVRKLVSNTWNYPWQMNLNSHTTPPDGTGLEDRSWTAIINEQKEKNKIEKLEDYVSKGRGSHLAEAKKIFEGLLWANIDKAKYVEKYVQHFPNGQYISQVEDKVYRRFADFNPDYYALLFPNGKYIAQIGPRLAAKNEKEENELWAKIRDGWDMYIDDYLKKFPQGKYIGQIDESLWQTALKKEQESAFKKDGFEKYLKMFPAGKHAAAADQKIKKYKL